MSELQAKLDLGMSVFLFCGLGILSMVQNRVSAELDESVQVCQGLKLTYYVEAPARPSPPLPPPPPRSSTIPSSDPPPPSLSDGSGL